MWSSSSNILKYAQKDTNVRIETLYSDKYAGIIFTNTIATVPNLIQIVGGLVLKLDGTKGDLELLFVKPNVHSKGIGYAAWCEVERDRKSVV